MSPADDAPPVSIDAYDCIIIDESHRGYTLDREMSEGEQELRGIESYVSSYRRVLDHFDAVKIGLTATPAEHTREIFGKPVFVYSYPDAVADGWLVDHEPPIRIVTQLARYGIKFDKGAEIQKLLNTGEIQLSLLPDEMEFDVAEFNRTVITDGFNRAVAAELAQHLDPTGPAKTISAAEARVSGASERISGIEQAALARAFRGELVEQDPNDEPAAALIERICALVDTRTENGAAKPRDRVARAKSQRRTTLAETES